MRAFALVMPATATGSRVVELVLEGEVQRQSPFQEVVHLKIEDLPLAGNEHAG